MQFPVRRPKNGLALRAASVLIVSALMLSIGGVASASAANHRHRHTGGSVTGRHPKHPGHGGVNHHPVGATRLLRFSWGKAGGTDDALYTLKLGALEGAVTKLGGGPRS